MYDDFITEGRGGIPWTAAAELHTTLRPPIRRQELTKEAARGLLKIRRLLKIAQDPEEAQALLAEQAMTDPDVVAALDQQELAAEREAMQGTIQQLQSQVLEAQQTAQAAGQQAQEASMQMQQQQALLDQAQAERQAAQQQAMAATDQAMAEQVAQQQNRQQLMQAADQLALQLKQVASQPTMAEQQQMAAQQQADPNAAAAQEQMRAAESAPNEEAAQEQQEAIKAQQDAQIQTQQAEQKTQEAAAKQEQKAQPQGAKVQVTVPQGQSAAPQDMAKASSDRMAETVALLRLARMRKEAGIPTSALYAAGGAALGAGAAGVQQAVHQKRYGKDQPSDKEIQMGADLQAAKIKAKRDPTYLNKMRVKSLEFELGAKQTDREHPGGAMARGALQGAVIGGLGGTALHSLGKRGITFAKAMKGAK